MSRRGKRDTKEVGAAAVAGDRVGPMVRAANKASLKSPKKRPSTSKFFARSSSDLSAQEKLVDAEIAANKGKRKDRIEKLTIKVNHRIKKKLAFPADWCDYDESNTQYKRDLEVFTRGLENRFPSPEEFQKYLKARFYERRVGESDVDHKARIHHFQDINIGAEYEAYKFAIKTFQLVKLGGASSGKVFGARARILSPEEIVSDNFLNLFFVISGSGRTAQLHKRGGVAKPNEELNFGARFKALEREIKEAKDLREIEKIFSRTHKKGEQSLVSEVLADAMRVHGDAKKLPFTFFKWLALAELSLIEEQIKIVNPIRLKNTLAFTQRTRDGLLFSTSLGVKSRKEAFYNVVERYTDWAQEIITPIVDPRLACLRQMQMLRDTGLMNVALIQPAMEVFESKFDDKIKFDDVLLSRTQLSILKALDAALVKNREIATRGGLRGRVGKIMFRAGTGAGKSYFVEEVIKAKYAEYIEVKSVDLNSSKEQLDAIFNGEGRLDEGDKFQLIALDEATLYSRYFTKRFLPDKDENFCVAVAGKTAEALQKEIVEREKAVLAAIKKLRERGANVFILGASESIEKVEYAECGRLDAELYEEQARLHRLSDEIEVRKDEMRNLSNAMRGIEAFNRSGYGAQTHSSFWSDHPADREALVVIVEDLHRAGVLSEDVKKHLIGHGLTEAEEDLRFSAQQASLYSASFAKFMHEMPLDPSCTVVQLQNKVISLQNIVREFGNLHVLNQEERDEFITLIFGRTFHSAEELNQIANTLNAKINSAEVQAKIADIKEKGNIEAVSQALIGTKTGDAVVRIAEALASDTAQAIKTNFEQLRNALAIEIGVKQANDFLAEIKQNRLPDEAIVGIKEGELRQELLLAAVDQKEKKLADRKMVVADLKKSIEAAKEKLTTSKFIAKPEDSYQDDDLEALVKDQLQGLFAEKDGVAPSNQRLQYILPDSDINQQNCSDEKLQEILTISGADIIIVPHLIEGGDGPNHVSEMGCRICYKNTDGTFTPPVIMTLSDLDGKPPKASQFEEIVKKLAPQDTDRRPNVISFFCGPDKKGEHGGNVVGGNYKSSLGTTSQIVHLKDPTRYNWSDCMQWFGRNRNPAGAAKTAIKVVAHKPEINLQQFAQILDANTKIHEQGNTLAHLELKAQGAAFEGVKERDVSKALRNQWMLRDYQKKVFGAAGHEIEDGRTKTDLARYIDNQRAALEGRIAKQEDKEDELNASSSRRESSLILANLDITAENPHPPSILEGSFDDDVSSVGDDNMLDLSVTQRGLSSDQQAVADRITATLESHIKTIGTIHSGFLEFSEKGKGSHLGMSDEDFAEEKTKRDAVTLAALAMSDKDFAEEQIKRKEAKAASALASASSKAEEEIKWSDDRVIITPEILQFVEKKEKSTATTSHVDIIIAGETYPYKKGVDYTNIRFAGLQFEEKSMHRRGLDCDEVVPQSKTKIFNYGTLIMGANFTKCIFKNIDFSHVEDFAKWKWKFNKCTFIDCEFPKCKYSKKSNARIEEFTQCEFGTILTSVGGFVEDYREGFGGYEEEYDKLSEDEIIKDFFPLTTPPPIARKPTANAVDAGKSRGESPIVPK